MARRDQMAKARETYVPSPDTDVRYALSCWCCGRHWDRIGLPMADGFLMCPFCGGQRIQILDAVLVPKA